MMRVVVMLLGALALAGCGGSGGEATPAGRSPEPTVSDGERLALDASAKSNARHAVSQVEACFVTVQTYQRCELPAKRLPVGSGPGQVELLDSAAATYEVVSHSESGATFRIGRDADYALTRTCEPAGTGGCSAAGDW